MKKKNTKELILIGGGRWAKIYLEELIKKKIKVNIVTSNYNLKKKFINQKFKNCKIFRKLNDINIKKNFYIIVSNATRKRLNIIKKIAYLKNEILIEKPLTDDPNDYFRYKLNKENIYLGLQFVHSNYLKFVKREIKNKKIESIRLDWFDNKKEKKTFNENINFIEDSYYHFFSIIRVFLNNKNLINNHSILKKNKIESIYNDTKIILNAAKHKYSKKRMLIIKTNKNKYTLNFKNINEILIKKNHTLKIKIIKNTKNIPIQINNFLFQKKKIQINSLKNLNYLFRDLIKLRKSFSKTET